MMIFMMMREILILNDDDDDINGIFMMVSARDDGFNFTTESNAILPM